MDDLVRQDVWENRTTWQDAVAKSEADPGGVAIWFDDGSDLKFGEAVDEARRLAVSLAELGLRKGDVVSANLPNWREMAIINLACCALGLVINPIIPIYRDHEVGFILKDAGSRVLFTPGVVSNFNYPEMARRLARQTPSLEWLVTVRPGDGETLNSSYSAMVEQGDPDRFQADQVDPNHIKLLMYTSGTTGVPKGVLHSHNTLRRSAANSAEARGVGEGDITLMASPVTHVTGYSSLEQAFSSPIKTALMSRWDKVTAVDFIERTGATLTVGATPFLKELVDEAQARGTGLSSLRQFACGGAEVPPQLIARAHDVLENCRCFRVYGSTEVPLVTQGFQKKEDARLAAETDGRIYNYDVRIVDSEGCDVAPGNEGEILARGPSMFLGYTDWEETEKAVDQDGYFHSGDLVRAGPQCSIVVTGRLKDLIIRGGENLSAKEIEDVLHRHPAIQEAAVVAMPHPRLGEGVCAWLILHDHRQRLGAEELRRFLHEQGLSPQKSPESIHIVDHFPRTASGKIQKNILRRKTRERLMISGRA
ncbi:AMP-binding protein [Sphingomonas sp. ID1715]|uniref:AMP-binding protein n=1 Tax=Sphingomonas sp. ID1715 TaxID=1656898 RepID=UPI001C2CB072|nr:AMP-binding protein [Sphingomonas sp. ID1715]